MTRGRRTPWLLLLPPLVVFLALFLLPLANLFALSFFGFDRVTASRDGTS